MTFWGVEYYLLVTTGFLLDGGGISFLNFWFSLKDSVRAVWFLWFFGEWHCKVVSNPSSLWNYQLCSQLFVVADWSLPFNTSGLIHISFQCSCPGFSPNFFFQYNCTGLCFDQKDREFFLSKYAHKTTIVFLKICPLATDSLFRKEGLLCYQSIW